ncbi:MAG TPA: DUF1573 domain-containing protein [Planctomycetota bacterium]|jgi:hypothetical protein
MNRSTGWIVCFLLFAYATPLRAGDGDGSISCDETVIDFGRKDSREDVKHTFMLRNKGSDTLRILNVEAPCGCTVAALPRQSIEPNEELGLLVTFRLAGRSGPQQKSIFVDSNARNRKRLELVMQGYAVSRVAIAPPSVFFGRAPSGKPMTDTVTITAGNGITFDVTGVKSDQKSFTPSFEVLEPGVKFKLVVAFDGQQKPGVVQGTIDVQTTSKEYPILHVPVTAHVVGELNLFPTELLLESGSEPVTKPVFVTGGIVLKFKILDVSAPFLKSAPPILRFGEDGYRIVLKGLVPSADLDGQKLTITTDAPTMKELIVPIRIVAPSDRAPTGKSGR